MPHVVLRGKVNVREWSDNFSPLIEQTDDWLIKADTVFLERQGNRALIPVVVVEEGHPQSFYIQLSSGINKDLIIRIDPWTDPIKTRGVKRAVALVAETFLHAQSQTEVERHNLQDLLAAKSHAI